MNKKGMNTGGVLAIVLLSILTLAIVGYGAYYLASQKTAQETIGTTEQPSGTTGIGAGCNVNPTLTLSALDALQSGTTRPVSADYRINGAYAGKSPSFNAGDEVEAIINSTTIDYVATTIESFKVACGPNPRTVKIYSYGNASLSILSDAGTSVLSDISSAGGTGEINETAFSSGGSKTWEISFTGNDKKSTGKMLYVIEGCTEGNVSSMTLSDSSGTAMPKLAEVPTGLTISGNNLKRVAFELPTINSAVKVKYNLNVALNTQKTCNGQPFYTTVYAKQWFVDTDGTFKEGVVDSLGNVKYVEEYDRDLYVALV